MVLEGHLPGKTSLLHMHRFAATQSEACMITVTVLEETNSPDSGHKVKIGGVIVSEGGFSEVDWGAKAEQMEWAGEIHQRVTDSPPSSP